MNILDWTPKFVIENEKSCKETLNKIWNDLPLLNCIGLDEMKSGTLVRFRGMIQDMRNPEYYFDKLEIANKNTNEKRIHLGRYSDVNDVSENEEVDYDSRNNVTNERNTLIVISFPGLNKWVEEIEQGKHAGKIEQQMMEGNKSMKRPAEEDGDEMETDSVEEQNKRQRTNDTPQNSQKSDSVSKEYILNFPLPDREGKCCIVKIYENSDQLKLNDMVDIVGFLSVDPNLTNVASNEEEEMDLESRVHNPSPALVPRIHCISYKKIKHCNPLLDTMSLNNQSDLNSARNDLSIILTQLLLGDKLAADYLICHLISMVYTRHDLLALGKFALNISNIPQIPEYSKTFYDFIQLMLPKSHYVSMSLDNLNSLEFTPKKDYSSNRLTSGLLQLSDNTHLVLDETALQPGQLNSAGCKGLQAISNIIKNQKASYDFNYYQMEYDCDIPFLILSEGKSLLPSDFHVPLEPDDHHVNTFPAISEAARQFLKIDLLNRIRVFLTVVRHAEYEFSENVLQVIQDEFVTMRQNQNATGDDLHQLLVLARLVCLSHGKQNLDEESWRLACDMESQRKNRLNNKA